MNDLESVDLTARLDRLERQNRRLRRLCLGCVIGVSLLAILGARQDKENEENRPRTIVESERFVLRDSQGRMRAVLGITPDGGPNLAFFDEEGNNRLGLEASKHWSALCLFDSKEQKRVQLATDEDKGLATLTVHDPDGSPRVVLGSTGNDVASLSLHSHGNEHPQILLLVPPAGKEASMVFCDENDKTRVSLGLMGEKEAQPALLMSSKDGKQRISLGTQFSDGTARLALMNGEEKLCARLGTVLNGAGSFLDFFAERPEPYIFLGTKPTGSKGLSLVSPDGKHVIQFGSFANNDFGVALGNADGQARAQIAIGPDGSGILSTFDATGKALFTTPAGEPN